MRCLPRSAVAVPPLAVVALALAACNGSTSDVSPMESGTDPAPTTSVAPVRDQGAATEEAVPARDGALVTETSAPATGDAGATSTADPEEAAGRTDRQAAADRTEEFLVAVVTADPALCQLVVGLNGDAPMADSPDQLRLCEEELIPQLQTDVEGQDAESIEAIQVEAASIEGDTARVTVDALEAFAAEGFGAADFVLQRFDAQWYVDLGQSDFGG